MIRAREIQQPRKPSSERRPPADAAIGVRVPCIVMAYLVMAYIVMAYIVMAYLVMAYIVMDYNSYGLRRVARPPSEAYIVMAYIVMTYLVMAYMVMAYNSYGRGVGRQVQGSCPGPRHVSRFELDGRGPRQLCMCARVRVRRTALLPAAITV